MSTGNMPQLALQTTWLLAKQGPTPWALSSLTRTPCTAWQQDCIAMLIQAGYVVQDTHEQMNCKARPCQWLWTRQHKADCFW